MLRKAAELNPLIAKASAAASGERGNKSAGIDDACCLEVEEIDATEYLSLTTAAPGGGGGKFVTVDVPAPSMDKTVAKQSGVEKDSAAANAAAPAGGGLEPAKRPRLLDKSGGKVSGQVAIADALSSSSAPRSRQLEGTAARVAAGGTSKKYVQTAAAAAAKSASAEAAKAAASAAASAAAEVGVLREELAGLKARRKAGELADEAEFQAAKTPLLKKLNKATRRSRLTLAVPDQLQPSETKKEKKMAAAADSASNEAKVGGGVAVAVRENKKKVDGGSSDGCEDEEERKDEDGDEDEEAKTKKKNKKREKEKRRLEQLRLKKKLKLALSANEEEEEEDAKADEDDDQGEKKKKKKTGDDKGNTGGGSFLPTATSQLVLAPPNLSSVSRWRALGLHPALAAALAGRGFEVPTPIQASVLPSALTTTTRTRRPHEEEEEEEEEKQDRLTKEESSLPRDVMGAAPTGSGKTLAYGLPMLDWLVRRYGEEGSSSEGSGGLEDSLVGLVLCPTRELALQVVTHLNSVLSDATTATILKNRAAPSRSDSSSSGGSQHKNSGVGHALAVAVVGGLSEHKQVRLLDKKPPIVVATPGRLWDLVSEKGHAHLATLHRLRFLVVDEADRLVQQGSFQELNSLFTLITAADEENSKRHGGGGEDGGDGDGEDDEEEETKKAKLLQHKAERAKAFFLQQQEDQGAEVDEDDDEEDDEDDDDEEEDGDDDGDDEVGGDGDNASSRSSLTRSKFSIKQMAAMTQFSSSSPFDEQTVLPIDAGEASVLTLEEALAAFDKKSKNKNQANNNGSSGGGGAMSSGEQKQQQLKGGHKKQKKQVLTLEERRRKKKQAPKHDDGLKAEDEAEGVEESGHAGSLDGDEGGGGWCLGGEARQSFVFSATLILPDQDRKLVMLNRKQKKNQAKFLDRQKKRKHDDKDDDEDDERNGLRRIMKRVGVRGEPFVCDLCTNQGGEPGGAAEEEEEDEQNEGQKEEGADVKKKMKKSGLALPSGLSLFYSQVLQKEKDGMLFNFLSDQESAHKALRFEREAAALSSSGVARVGSSGVVVVGAAAAAAAAAASSTSSAGSAFSSAASSSSSSSPSVAPCVRTLVFVNSILTAKRVAVTLSLLGVDAKPLHAEMPQKQRLKALDRFKKGVKEEEETDKGANQAKKKAKTKTGGGATASSTGTTSFVLVCTDVAARGLDVPNVSSVVHYDLPRTADSFVHRSGRTARAHQTGVALSLVSESDQQAYATILKAVFGETATVGGGDGQLPLAYPVPNLKAHALGKQQAHLAGKVVRLEDGHSKDGKTANWFQQQAKEMDMILDDKIDTSSSSLGGEKRRRKEGGDERGDGSSAAGKKEVARLRFELAQLMAVSVRGGSYK